MGQFDDIAFLRRFRFSGRAKKLPRGNFRRFRRVLNRGVPWGGRLLQINSQVLRWRNYNRWRFERDAEVLRRWHEYRHRFRRLRFRRRLHRDRLWLRRCLLAQRLRLRREVRNWCAVSVASELVEHRRTADATARRCSPRARPTGDEREPQTHAQYPDGRGHSDPKRCLAHHLTSRPVAAKRCFTAAPVGILARASKSFPTSRTDS
jgi:hypothetical protein